MPVFPMFLDFYVGDMPITTFAIGFTGPMRSFITLNYMRQRDLLGTKLVMQCTQSTLPILIHFEFTDAYLRMITGKISVRVSKINQSKIFPV